MPNKKTAKNSSNIPKSTTLERTSVRLKGDYYFTLSIASNIIESQVECWIEEIKSGKTATLKFDLIAVDGIQSTKIITIENNSCHDHKWVHDSIDLISPMIYRALTIDNKLPTH